MLAVGPDKPRVKKGGSDTDTGGCALTHLEDLGGVLSGITHPNQSNRLAI
jgi:hypothetical protein